MQKRILPAINENRVTIYFILLAILTSFRISEQDLNEYKSILKSQQSFYKKHIPKQESHNYYYLLKYSKKLLPVVIDNITKEAPSFFEKSDSFNLIEGYNPNSTSFEVMIWKRAGEIYFYDFMAPKGNAFSKYALENIPFDKQAIIKGFSDWRNAIFKYLTAGINTADDGTYYFGSKVNTSTQSSVETFAFYK